MVVSIKTSKINCALNFTPSDGKNVNRKQNQFSGQHEAVYFIQIPLQSVNQKILIADRISKRK